MLKKAVKVSKVLNYGFFHFCGWCHRMNGNRITKEFTVKALLLNYVDMHHQKIVCKCVLHAGYSSTNVDQVSLFLPKKHALTRMLRYAAKCKSLSFKNVKNGL